jgi:hypothetical protein
MMEPSEVVAGTGGARAYARVGLLSSERAIMVRVSDLAVLIRQLQGEAEWHELGASGEPAFSAGWSNVGSSYATAAFRKPRPDLVALKGSITGGVANGAAAWTMPAGYRPEKDRRMSTTCAAAGGVVYPVILLVTPTGLVLPYALGASGTITELHLDASFWL